MSKRIGRLPLLTNRQLKTITAIFLAIAGTSALAAPKLLVNEFFRSGNLSTTDEWIEVVLTEDMTAAQLNAFSIGDSASSTASKFSGYQFTNMALIAADFPAGTIIVLAGDTGPTADAVYDPSGGDWNVTLKTSGSHFTGNGSSGDLAGTDVVYSDTDGTNGNTTISADGFAVNYDSTPGTFGSNASVTVTAPANVTGVVLNSDLAGATINTNWSTGVASASLTPGAANGGANTTYIDNLRAALSATPNLSIDDVSMAEGDAGTTTFSFTVTIDAMSASDVTFDYATLDGTATTADSDYVAIATTGGTITAGNLTTTIDVTVNADATIEADETFTVDLSNVVGANATDASGLGTILDDDAPVWIINELQSDPDATNGDANGDGVVSTTNDEFVEIVNNSGGDIDISGWVLSDGVGPKHTFPANTVVRAHCAIVVFAGGTPTGTFGYAEVQTASSGSLGLNNGGDSVILNDGMTDVVSHTYGAEGGNNQSITRDPDITGSDPLVQHSTATGSGGALFSPGTLINGSNFSGCTPPAPNITISDVSANEGDGPGNDLIFAVTLDGDASAEFSVTYTIVDGTATVADSDYDNSGSGGTITFTGGTAGTVNIVVPTIGDTTPELDEDFSVVISNVSAGNAVIADDTGVGTILNDDAALPNVTISDASALEGDGAGNNLSFDLTLDIDASAEFSVTYTLSDGSATGGVDYNDSGSGGTVTFTGGIAGTQQIVVPTIGDTDYEGDETFSVIISNVTAGNAVITDDTGIGTIQNDDCAPISAVQGSGAFSPFVPGASLSAGVNGSGVALCEAIVTAVTYNTSNAQLGFFMQSLPADDDGDPATSEGMYVFTGFTTVAVGDRVQVSGTVREHFAMTEMVHDAGVMPLTVSIISSGNPLPTPVVFSAGSGLPSINPGALSCPNSGPDTMDPLNTDTNFECFEAMLVTVPDAVALNGNFRRTNDTYSEIQFSPRADRSLREAGLVFPQTTGVGNAAAPLWDGNPEIMEMDPDIARRGATGPTPGIDTQIIGGARFSATGPLTFDFGDYVLWPTDLLIDAASNLLPRPVEAPLAATELSIGSFNMQHLCDDDLLDGCNRDSPRYPGLFGLPVWDYVTKNARVAAYVCDVLLAPDVLGAQEVDSQTTLADLATAIFDDCGVSYSAALVDGNDPGGIDVGYLTRDDRVSVDSVTQFFQPDQWPDPGCSPAPCTDDLHDRPPLLLRGQFTSAPGAVPFEFAVLNNHTKARSNVDKATLAAERDRAKRFWQARDIAELVQDFQTASGDFTGLGTDAVPLILVGDYNAYQFTDGRVDVLGLIAGTYDDDANECNAILQDGSSTVETCNIGTNIVSPALQNLVLSATPGEAYSFLFIEDLGQVLGYGTSGADRDVVSGNVLDHILAAQTALPYVSGIGFGRANHDVSVQSIVDGLAPDGAGGTQSSLALRSSDHDGLVAYFETNCANLTIPPGSEPDPDADGVCTFADNCPAIANSDQTDANANGLGAACDATPVAVNDPATGNYAATEDSMLSVPAAGLLANDTDSDGDSLSAALVDGALANGSVSVNADGSFSYTPNANFCDDANPVSFTYAASDGESASIAATASILVACVNDAPAISDIASPQMTPEETAVVVGFTITDVDSTLTCSAANLTATSSNATLMPVSGIVFSGTAPNCSATLTPASNQTGNSTIRITVSDGALESFDEFVLSVSNVDDQAVLSDDTASVNEDAPATAIDVLANDVDLDSPLLITGVTSPANGTVLVTGGGTGLTYQPDANYCNDGDTTDNFSYNANGQTANVSVTVNCVDDDAVAVADTATVTQNSTANLIGVLGNDTADPDFALSIDSVDATSAQGGSVNIDGSQVSYTPAAGFCGGTDTFDYTLVGGSSATVTVTVDCLDLAIFADGFEN